MSTLSEIVNQFDQYIPNNTHDIKYIQASKSLIKILSKNLNDDKTIILDIAQQKNIREFIEYVCQRYAQDLIIED